MGMNESYVQNDKSFLSIALENDFEINNSRRIFLDFEKRLGGQKLELRKLSTHVTRDDFRGRPIRQ
jgi:hypothetical protein